MIKCPLCLKEVLKLKSNSHIIPKNAISPYKENGKNLLLSIPKNSIRPNQKDWKADIVCDECEDRFRDNDTFCASFFRDFSEKPTAVIESSVRAETKILEYENEISSKIVQFCYSILVRYELAASKPLLNSKFELLRKSYMEELFHSFHIFVFYKPAYSGTVIYPYVEQVGRSKMIYFSLHSFEFGVLTSSFVEPTIERLIKELSIMNTSRIFQTTHNLLDIMNKQSRLIFEKSDIL